MEKYQEECEYDKKLKLILLCICIILATGCSKNTKANRKLNTSNSVDKVLNEQINNSTKKDNENDGKNMYCRLADASLAIK